MKEVHMLIDYATSTHLDDLAPFIIQNLQVSCKVVNEEIKYCET